MTTPPPVAGPGRPDFAALLDRVALRSLRGQLIDHLDSFQHVEFGHTRPLDHAEAAMVLTVVDTFLRERSLTKLPVSEIQTLCECLNDCASQEDVPSPAQYRAMRNACFDAMACIKALEARLRGLTDRHILISESTRPLPTPCNDR